MLTQSQILRTLRTSEPRLLRTLEAHAGESRTAISRQVCHAFGFRDARGNLQQTGCLKALKTLESEDRLSLPAPRRTIASGTPRLLDRPVPEPVEVPASLKQIKGLALELVEDAAQRARWNTLMAAEHPQGVRQFAGAQIKYLFRSDHGYLGAIGFAASGLYVGPRDRWMAWTHAQRQQHLMRVVGLNRLLIRPGVKVKNLASHLLGKVLKRLPVDFQARYGYAPWVVETFVGPEQRGTCFRAAGFHYVGRTTGRGRHAETKACTRTKKAVFVYDLDRRWRKHLGVAHVEAYPKLEAGAGLDAETWAAQEFGDAQLGDKRRTTRLVNSVTILARAPGESITATMKSDRAAIRGYYRFIEKAHERGTTPADILAPHRRRTIERMRTEKTVLCLQDGTDINYSTRPACEGLEVIGRNQTTAKARGVHLHTTLALSAQGLPLGVLRCAYRTQAGKHAAKTQQWIDGLHDLAEAATHLSSKTRVLCVMDREADIFALFAAQQPVGRVDLLVRAKANRRLGRKGPLLFEFMRQGAPKGTIEVAIQRLSRREKSGRVKHKGRAGRIAQMEVRYRTVMLPPTRGQQGGPVKVTAIHVGEADPPEGQKAIQWYLLTTREVTSVAQAVTMVDYYMLRWRVEDGFRILKSVCKVQELRLQKADSLHLAITINMVMAWRLHLMTLLGRQDPEAPAEILFTDIELCVLREYAEGFNLASPDDLAAAILLVALMGGYMNRKSDPPPGAKIMSRGYLRLEACAFMFAVLQKKYGLWPP